MGFNGRVLRHTPQFGVPEFEFKEKVDFGFLASPRERAGGRPRERCEAFKDPLRAPNS